MKPTIRIRQRSTTTKPSPVNNTHLAGLRDYPSFYNRRVSNNEICRINAYTYHFTKVRDGGEWD